MGSDCISSWLLLIFLLSIPLHFEQLTWLVEADGIVKLCVIRSLPVR